MKALRAVLCFVVFAAVPTDLSAAPIRIDFESLADSEVLIDQIAGLTFSSAIALTAGISLNEFEFPPSSGVTVVSDFGGPMRIDFLSPVESVSGRFTYATRLTFSAFDSTGALLGSALSLFDSSMGLSGDPGSSPKEKMSFAGPGIAYVVISGAPGGDSFVLDDLTYGDSGAVPEPTALSLLLLGGLGAAVRAKRAR